MPARYIVSQLVQTTLCMHNILRNPGLIPVRHMYNILRIPGSILVKRHIFLTLWYLVQNVKYRAKNIRSILYYSWNELWKKFNMVGMSQCKLFNNKPYILVGRAVIFNACQVWASVRQHIFTLLILGSNIKLWRFKSIHFVTYKVVQWILQISIKWG
jgi:hypothetical protein